MGMVRRKKVVITGAAGNVGTALRKRLRDRYDFRLVFHSHVPDDVDDGDEVVVSDVTDYEAMLEVGSGADAIVHLAIAGHSTKIRNPVHRSRLVLDVDIPGVYNILESARINGVPTVVFASTNHVSGMYEKEGLLSVPDAPVRPDGVYAAGKAFGEALGRFYSDQHGLRVLCLRIANFNNKEEPERYYEPGYSRWLSPRDLAQLTWRCIETEEVKFGIFFGVSGGSEKKWDLSNARTLLGYEPEDDGSLPEYRSMYQKE
jgi:uronate dehydrogenase